MFKQDLPQNKVYQIDPLVTVRKENKFQTGDECKLMSTAHPNFLSGKLPRIFIILNPNIFDGSTCESTIN